MLKFEELKIKIKRYNPRADFKLIEKAFYFALKVHHGQKRLSGEDFINHPLFVAKTLVDWKLDSASVAAGLLHDVIEDGGVEKETIEKNFNQVIAKLVDGVSKIGEIKLRGKKKEEFVENLRKMIVVMAKDLRVVLIKLADRYHNLQTLWALPKEKQTRIARETLEVYAPLAERLGIGEIKGRLEDLSFHYVYPKDYQWLKKTAKSSYYNAEIYIQEAISSIKKALIEEKIHFQIQSRAKHFYSLWRKLLRPEIDKDIEKIYDLMAIRIIVGSIRDCYAVLGVVHKLFKPVPHVGIRDFIAQPKPNGYRSIHTTVFGPKGKIFEIQIRTQQMHEEAENGIAAHWYMAMLKNKGKLSSEAIDKGKFFAPDEKLNWVQQLVAWQKEIVDSKEFLKALRFDALRHRIFVFSPKGDVYDLPAEATPIDFAYAVHTDLGDQAVGAKVNGKLVKLKCKLKSGDIVEIIKKEDAKPSYDWLSFVITRTAKRKIERYFRQK